MLSLRWPKKQIRRIGKGLAQSRQLRLFLNKLSLKSRFYQERIAFEYTVLQYLNRQFLLSSKNTFIIIHINTSFFIHNLITSNFLKGQFPVGIYLLKVNNRNTRTKCEICSKLTIKTQQRRHRRRSGVFIVNFECISHLVLVFLLLILNI